MGITLGKSIALVVGGMLIGGGTATLILKKHYQRILEEEIASVKAAYKADTVNLKKQNLDLLDQVTQPKTTQDEMDKPLSEEDIMKLSVSKLISDQGYGGGVIDEDEAPRFRLYDRTTDNFNPAEEERSEDEPYVISVAEFQNDEEDYDKITVRYFEDDETLVGEMRKDPLPIESAGAVNLTRFGVGSDDPNILYIRNEKLEIDFEVIRDDGSYTESVLGIPEWNADDIEDRKPRVKKMRDSSD